MVVLDTNVVSELMGDDPHADVLLWLDDRPTRELFVTAITEAEIRTGIALLPQGRRRRGIAAAADRAFGALFAGRVLPFDSPAARRANSYVQVQAPPLLLKIPTNTQKKPG